MHGLLEKVGALTAAGSLLGLDVMNRGLFFSPVAWPMRAALARRAGTVRDERSGDADGPPRLGGGRDAARGGRGELRAVVQADGAPGVAGLAAKLPGEGAPLVDYFARIAEGIQRDDRTAEGNAWLIQPARMRYGFSRMSLELFTRKSWRCRDGRTA